MFSSGTPLQAERRTRGGTVRRSQSRAGSIANLAGSDTGTPPPTASKAGPRSRALAARTSSSRRQSLLPTGRTPSRAGSRLGSVAQFDEDDAGGEDGILSVEDDSEQVDNQGVLLKSDTHSVSILGGSPRAHLPAEVLEVLANSDFYSDPHTASIDVNVGYACLVGKTKCYVWSIANMSKEPASSNATPTCYIFPVPEAPSLSLAATTFAPVPFVAFVSVEGGAASSTSRREPGFLLVTAWGRALYWGSTSAALSGLDKYVDQDVGLAQGEVVRAMTAISPTRYVLATSGSRLLSLKIQTSFSSTAVLSVKPISRASGMFARMGSLFGGAALDPQGGVVALASSKTSGSSRGQVAWSVFAATSHVIQEWRFSDDGQEFVGETDVYETLHDNMAGILGLQDGRISNLEIVDAKIRPSSMLTVLIAFTPPSHQQLGNARRRLSYAVAELDNGSVTYMKTLSYAHEVDPRPLSSPRIHLASSEKLCFVAFPDMVIATFLDPKQPFEESVALKDAARDRLLGSSISDVSSLAVLAAHTGFLGVDINVQHVQALATEASRVDPADLATRHLKTRLEQAVLFADNQQNPLTFNLALSNEEGDLVSAVESVSKEILTSSSIYLPVILDLRAQIADRASRLRFLMKYLHDNSLMKRLSKTSKRHLAWDAEKLAGVMSLWSAHSTGTHILHQAAESLHLSDTAGEDVVRNCFRRHSDCLDTLLAEYLPILQQQALNTSLPLNERTSVLFYVDRDLSLVYKALTRHRLEQGGLYGIPLGPDSQTCLSEPWSSRRKLLELLRVSFDATDSLLMERSRTIGSSIDDDTNAEYGSTERHRSGRAGASVEEERETQRLLKTYLIELADYTLAMHQERMSYLQSLGDDAQAVKELRELLETYVQLRPRVINSMVRLSRGNAAYDLAERYRDFRSLVVLCNDASLGSPARVHFYIQKYKEDFAFALYDWYIETGRTHELMTQDPTYGPMLAIFLRLRNLPGLAWMQNVVEGRVEDASRALLQQANSETSLSEQKLMLSIAKLARVAACTRAQVEGSPQIQQNLEAIDDRLDIAASHDRLLDICKTVLDPRDLLKPVETQATVLMGRLCSRVSNAEIIKLGSYLFRRLLLGDAMLPEDLVDLFSLKDNAPGPQSRDYAYSLEILGRDRQTPQTRRDIASKCVWRRVYLADDFVDLRRLASTSNDQALAEALRTTALYATVHACHRREAGSIPLLRPAEALYLSTPQEDSSLTARFSNEVYHGEIDTEAIASEYARESHLIQGMCDDKMVRLGEFYDEVQRLVKIDLEQAAAVQGSILAEMDDSRME